MIVPFLYVRFIVSLFTPHTHRHAAQTWQFSKEEGGGRYSPKEQSIFNYLQSCDQINIIITENFLVPKNLI